MKYLNRDILFYDIEIILNHFVLVLMHPDKSLERIFIIDGEGVGRTLPIDERYATSNWTQYVVENEEVMFALEHYVDNYTLIGYNNYGFDDHLVTAMLRGQSTTKVLKHIANSIIDSMRNNTKKPFINKRIHSLDCIQQIAVQPIGLKNIQANKGENIHEMNVAHDFAGVLSDEELVELTNYCISDVSSTIDVFNERQVYFQNKQMLVKLGNHEDERTAIRWNSTTLSANLFGKLTPTLINFSEFKVPKDIVDYWEKYWFADKTPEPPLWREFGNTMTFGFGGLHGVNDKYKIASDVLHIDVASMYPNLIINLDILGEYTQKYKDMLNRRIELKHSKLPEDQAMQEALKLILNSIYGLLGNKYSALYNFGGMRLVCFKGMEAIYNLAQRLSDYGTIYQVNTDGVYFKPNQEGWSEVVDAFEEEFCLDLDRDPYDKLIQRDVNNYIAVEKMGRDWSDSKVKVKGTLKTHSNDWFYANNNFSIVTKAVIEKLVFDKDILDTVSENVHTPRLYQYIAKVGNQFEGTVEMNERNMCTEYSVTITERRRLGADTRFHPENIKGIVLHEPHPVGDNTYIVEDKEAFELYMREENLYNSKGVPLKLKSKVTLKEDYEVLHTKYNRLFVTKGGTPFRKVKLLEDGRVQLSAFPSVPDNTTVFNDDLDNFDLKLDVGYYYQLAEEMYEQFI